ncbi:hypothetical protein [Aestuariicoccus sp. MJ-SS9]|uniref:hypothetical protein n=1 Tax=Aestuariicoccus sp. MJ-SS9 TaxID=3079855 RepID=UPI00290C53B6|nr:hypothetical protein [Aestuariicoccus sp. MJ-SS9]MDU8911247.1 hypothetical protein [Aestuariicoccus sp. MJ-SS9]
MWFDDVIKEVVVLATSAGISFGICAFVAAAALDDYTRNRALPALFGLSIIGAAAGITGGLSRDGAVGEIIPAALALVGSVAAYVFGVEKDTGAGARAGFAAAAFALSLSFGYAAGAARRSPTEITASRVAACDALFANALVLADKVAFRRAVDVHGWHCAGFYAGQITDVADPSWTPPGDDGKANGSDLRTAGYNAIRQKIFLDMVTARN